MLLRRISILLAAFAAIVTATDRADASAIIDRNATNVTLRVNGEGMAVVGYRDGDRVRNVLAWDAINDDVKFRLDYSGGWGTFKRPVWKSIKACLPYDGPPLAWLVVACKAPDGTYWALQRWQRLLPNQGYRPFTQLQAAHELHLSHWRGPLPQLELHLDFVFRGKFEHLFGRYHYRGKGVHGYRSSSTGVPLDPYGRNIYLDVAGSVYAEGWVRENSFLAHRHRGTFCYGFYPRPSYYDDSTRPPGHGKMYRATAIGPGVAPDPYWEGVDPGPFDPDREAEMNRLQDELMGGDRLCRQH